MGTCYYLVNPTRREVLSIGKAWALVPRGVDPHGRAIDAGIVRAADTDASEYRERVARWLDGRDAVVMLDTSMDTCPFEDDYGNVREGWTCWDAQAHPSSIERPGWLPWPPESCK